MPKILEYPRASLKASLELAKVLSDLGGSAKLATAAESLGMKEGGAFNAVIGAASKYGLIDNSRGQLTISGLYREFKHAYNEDDAANVLKKVFLGVPLFQRVYDRFRDGKLPVDILGKMLVREFDVDEAMASRVATYLIDAARQAKMLNDDNSFTKDGMNGADAESANQEATGAVSDGDGKPAAEEPPKQDQGNVTEYTIHFKGPGMDSKIKVADGDDFEIVQAILNKIKRKFSAGGMEGTAS